MNEYELEEVEVMSRKAAIAYVKERGFTVLFDKGYSGDFAHGSRLYFKRPNAKLNNYGFPFDHATVSRLARSEWAPSIFDGNEDGQHD